MEAALKAIRVLLPALTDGERQALLRELQGTESEPTSLGRLSAGRVYVTDENAEIRVYVPIEMQHKRIDIRANSKEHKESYPLKASVYIRETLKNS